MPLHRLSPTRREFMLAAGALATGAASGCGGMFADFSSRRRSPSEGTTWLMLSDVHIAADEKLVWNASNPAENLHRAVNAALDCGPAHALINGDIAFESGKPADYEHFDRIMKPLAARDIALHMTVGNHDDRSSLRRTLLHDDGDALDGKWVSSLLIDGTRWIFLDSLAITNEVGGDLGAAQLSWLARVLDNQPDIPTIVVFHHNPDDLIFGLRDAQALYAALLPRRHVKAVIFGHSHAFNAWTNDGLHFLNLPATGYLFHPLTELGWVLATVYDDGMSVELRTLTAAAKAPKSFYLPWRV